VFGYVSLGHSCRAIARNALAYSNIRRIWWPLAYGDLPFMFVIFGLVHTRGLPTFVSLGHASAHIDRNGAGGDVRPPQRAVLLWLIVVGEFFVTLAVVPLVVMAVWPAVGPDFLFAWNAAVVGVPVVGCGAPMVIQYFRTGEVDAWIAKTAEDTGRRPVKASTLGSWPIKGGGRKRSTGHGLELVRALAADARSRGQIKVGVARDLKLAKKYVAKTSAEQSPDNPKHVR
jgi:hypothetical protein